MHADNPIIAIEPNLKMMRVVPPTLLDAPSWREKTLLTTHSVRAEP
jgi:hypothetical protein